MPQRLIAKVYGFLIVDFADGEDAIGEKEARLDLFEEVGLHIFKRHWCGRRDDGPRELVEYDVVVRQEVGELNALGFDQVNDAHSLRKEHEAETEPEDN